MTIKKIRINCKDFIQLESTPSQNINHLLDCDVLLCFLLNKERSWLFAHDDTTLTPKQYNKFLTLCKKRSTGLPIAYITKKKEFFGYDFFVNKNVLIPKPDTEILIEQVLIEISQNSNYSSFADICTGSGCIALSILNEFKKIKHNNFKFYATDISKKALFVAKKNAMSLAKDEFNNKQIIFLQGDLCIPILKKEINVDMIVTNPPYVPTKIAKELLKDGRNEPRIALDGKINNEDGLKIIRRLIPQCYKLLNTNGKLFMEVGEYHAEKVAKIFDNIGFNNIEIIYDYAGLQRVVKATKL
ncbi:MAG: peptide chain release factor N(5)-glutamine methyltransferase [Treponema sp.]|nr:peptide chain release factor N(5)-glutamine methyltransferase [Treponema sp.]